MKEKGCGQTPAIQIGQKKKFQRCLMLFWLLLTLAVMGAVLLVMFVTGLFSNADRHLKQQLDVQLQSTSSHLQSYLDQLTAQSLSLSADISREIESLMMRTGLSFSKLNDDPEMLLELQEQLYFPVSATLQMANCSGAYAVFDVTANTSLPSAEYSRSGLYLRCVNITGANLVDPDVSFFRGIPDVARHRGMELHNRWNLEVDTRGLPGYTDLVTQQVSRPAEHYYWTERVSLKDTWEEALLLCVPIVGDGRTVYGVCGVEISSLFFQLAAPVRQMDCGPVAIVLAPLENGQLMLQKGLIGGTSGAYFDRPDNLTIHQGREFNIYTGGTGEYVGVQQQVNISQEDDEYRNWVVALLLPRGYYDDYFFANQQVLIFSCLGVLLVLVMISVLMYWKFLRPIEKAMLASGQGRDTGTEESEILIRFVQTEQPFEEPLPDDVAEAMKRFVCRARQLRSEEQEIFRLLAAGCVPAELSEKTGWNRRTAEKRLKLLCEELNVGSVEDILLYMDFFRRCGRLEELQKI